MRWKDAQEARPCMISNEVQAQSCKGDLFRLRIRLDQFTIMREFCLARGWENSGRKRR